MMVSTGQVLLPVPERDIASLAAARAEEARRHIEHLLSKLEEELEVEEELIPQLLLSVKLHFPYSSPDPSTLGSGLAVYNTLRMIVRLDNELETFERIRRRLMEAPDGRAVQHLSHDTVAWLEKSIELPGIPRELMLNEPRAEQNPKHRAVERELMVQTLLAYVANDR